MARWVRHGVGIGIIVAGYCAASQFRIDSPSATSSIGKRDTQPTDLRSTDITLQLAPSAIAPVASPRPAKLPAKSSERDQQPTSRSSLSGQQPPPSLAADYQLLEQNGSAASLTFDETSMEREARERRTHTIRDGDSLERIAERYLGDADRWRELLEANADVLTSRDLLPVDTVIEIPSRRFDKHLPATGTVQQAMDDELVPVRNP